MDVRAAPSREDARVHIELRGTRDLLPLAAAMPVRYPCLLESVGGSRKTARYDILFAFPQEVIESRQDSDAGFLDRLDDAFLASKKNSPDSKLPFNDGWFVFLSYEFAAQVEPSLSLPPSSDTAMPIALAVRCGGAIVVDRVTGTTTLLASDLSQLDVMRGDLDRHDAPVNEAPDIASIEEDAPEIFLDGVARIHEHLRDGDTFQINLSREWRANLPPSTSAASIYARLRRSNPAPFSALLQWRGWSVISSSPERLIEVRNRVAQTRPIAGTRPRAGDDAERIRELIANPKERAEHVMLIDLERNDLGRVCVPGSVRVDELMSVESYAHVHHIVSNVRGTLRDEITPGDIIRAVFPGGTITGCPKVRCVQIIADLERARRGAYTGSIGYLDCNGDMDLNILIRTLTLHGDRLSFRAGAGIVADSNALAELDETRAKARGLLRALGAPS